MKFVGVKEAASMLGYANVQSIYNLVYNGELAFYKIKGRKQLLFDPCDLESKWQPRKTEALSRRADEILNENEMRQSGS